MKLPFNLEKAYQTLRQYIHQSPVVLLHPNSRYRSLLVARLACDPSFQTFYYPFHFDDVDIASFLNNIIHRLAAQKPTFGQHTILLPDSIYEPWEQNLPLILHTFIKDLAELSDRPYILIFDEYDYCDLSDEVQYFIERLTLELPLNCTLIINSRTMPRLSWMGLIARNRATLLLDDERLMDNFYGFANHEESILEVYALGPGFVRLNGEFVDSWEGHLPRLMLFYALDRPTITRTNICRAFWPELNGDDSVNIFHVTKRRLHRALHRDVLEHQDGYYRFDHNLPMYYDTIEFVKALIMARDPNNAEALESWYYASRLYRGPYLKTHTEPWIEERRADFREGYIEALRCLAQDALQRQNYEHTLMIYQKILEADPLLLDINLALMRLLALLGRRVEAILHYRNLELLYEHQQLPVPPSLIQLYQELMN
ncbi:MAG: hypothetical protein MUF87_05560 [Anaerolineae bacterium]|jgi:DNA-binding SARP family transcriptional activator|nr:hypothetical protein [Anaerolineae bacterium]